MAFSTVILSVKLNFEQKNQQKKRSQNALEVTKTFNVANQFGIHILQ